MYENMEGISEMRIDFDYGDPKTTIRQDYFSLMSNQTQGGLSMKI